MLNIFEQNFGNANGRQARLFVLDSGKMRVGVTDFGCTLAFIKVRGADGLMHDCALSYPDASGYARGASFLGATVGRYAGRIAGASFSLAGKQFLLEKNDGENHLHGGFSKRFWEAEVLENGVRFSLLSPDMDEGFPGELRAFVLVGLEGGTLRLSYEAVSGRDTVLNLTNHTYFNLNGGGDIKDHRLRLHSRRFAELDPGMIPTGRLVSVRGTPLDFTRVRRIGEISRCAELAAEGGVDHSFFIEACGEGPVLCAELYSPASGIGLAVRTTQPSVHVYTGNFLQNDPALRFPQNGGICFETQRFPDSPNKPAFPTAVLRAGERYFELTEFEFFAG